MTPSPLPASLLARLVARRFVARRFVARRFVALGRVVVVAVVAVVAPLVTPLVTPLVACTSDVAPIERTAQVLHVEGTVTVDRGGRGAEPLVAEVTLGAMDTVHVGPASFVLLHLSNPWLTRLDADNHPRVAELVAFAKPPTTTSVAEQLELYFTAGERDRLPTEQVLLQRVAGVQARLRPAQTTSAAQDTLVAVPAAASSLSAPLASPGSSSSSAGAVASAPAPALERADGVAAPVGDVDSVGGGGGGFGRGAARGALAGDADASVASRRDEAVASEEAKGAPPAAATPSPPSSAKRARDEAAVDAGVRVELRLVDAAAGEAPAGTATMDALRSARGALGSCGGPAGTGLKVRLRVDVHGAVSGARVDGPGTTVAAVDACVVRTIARSKLPPRDGAVELVVAVRFVGAAAP